MIGGRSASASYALPSLPSLPAPKVQTFRPDLSYDPLISDGPPVNGATRKVRVTRFISITTPGVPAAVLKDPAKYKLQIELLRYTRSSNRSPATNARRKQSGYVHPSNGPAPSGVGSFTHGGVHSVHPDIAALRQTEWPILTGKEHTDVTQGMVAFMALIGVNWRDAAGAYAIETLPCPTSSRMRRPNPGARFPYSATFSPAYFAFRLSIIDPSDPRGKRIHGPASEVVSLTTKGFPFSPDGLDPAGKAACVLAGVSPFNLNFAIGASSRLPG
jgi:hypothetical protein